MSHTLQRPVTLIPALFPLEDIFLNEYFIVLEELHENHVVFPDS